MFGFFHVPPPVSAPDDGHKFPLAADFSNRKVRIHDLESDAAFIEARDICNVHDSDASGTGPYLHDPNLCVVESPFVQANKYCAEQFHERRPIAVYRRPRFQNESAGLGEERGHSWKVARIPRVDVSAEQFFRLGLRNGGHNLPFICAGLSFRFSCLGGHGAEP